VKLKKKRAALKNMASYCSGFPFWAQFHLYFIRICGPRRAFSTAPRTPYPASPFLIILSFFVSSIYFFFFFFFTFSLFFSSSAIQQTTATLSCQNIVYMTSGSFISLLNQNPIVFTPAVSPGQRLPLNDNSVTYR